MQALYRMIVVDDEPHVVEGVKGLLDWEDLGFDIVDTFEQADPALAFLSQHSVDVVMTDIRMPGFNGLEFVQAIKNRKLNPKVVIMTGYKEFDYVKRAMDLQVSGLLVKPIFEEEVLKVFKPIYDELKASEAALFQGDISQNEWVMYYLRSLKEHDLSIHPSLLTFEREQLSQGVWVLWIEYELGESLSVERTGIKGFDTQALAHVWLQKRKEKLLLKGRSMCFDIDFSSLQAMKHVYLQLLEQVQYLTDIEKYENVPGIEALEDLFDQLVYGFNGNQIKDIKTNMEKVFVIFSNYRMPIETCKRWLIKLFLKLDVKSEILSYQTYELNTQENLQGLWRQSKAIIKAWGEKQQHHALRQPQVIQTIEAYMKDHYVEKLTIKSIADLFFMHPSYLGQLMKQSWGHSFHDHLHNIRIEVAKTCIMETQTPIEQIGFQVGYGNYQQFLKHFKEITGQIPMFYRK